MYLGSILGQHRLKCVITEQQESIDFDLDIECMMAQEMVLKNLSSDHSKESMKLNYSFVYSQLLATAS